MSPCPTTKFSLLFSINLFKELGETTMKKNVMYFISNFCTVFIMTGFIALQQVEASSIQLADAAANSQEGTIKSHEGTATVKSIDMDKGIVKLAHDPIASLKWPAMTMNFKVKNSALMQGIKVNDAVTFVFIKSNGDYVITHIKSGQ